MVKNNFKKYYFVGLVTFGMIVAVIAFVLLFLNIYKNTQKLNAELNVKKQDLSILMEKLDKLKILKDREDQLKEEEQVVVRAIPTKKEVGELFMQIDGLLSENSGIIKSVSEGAPLSSTTAVGQSTVVEGLSSSDYAFEATFPSYDNFKIFLDKSQKALRYLTLNTFSVVKADDGNFTVQLNYTSYYRSK